MLSLSAKYSDCNRGAQRLPESRTREATGSFEPCDCRAAWVVLGLALLFGGAGCESKASTAADPSTPSPDKVHPTTTRWPEAAAGLRTQAQTSTGKPVVVACSVCHAGPSGGMAARNPQGRVVHASISLSHGELSCYACHDRDNRDRLRLADGQHVEFPDAMRLCAQCHGPQKRDYDHGAHGGMNGYWDLSRGPRQRNHCLVCHGAHVPAVPVVLPEPPPTDLERHE